MRTIDRSNEFECGYMTKNHFLEVLLGYSTVDWAGSEQTLSNMQDCKLFKLYVCVRVYVRAKPALTQR